MNSGEDDAIRSNEMRSRNFQPPSNARFSFRNLWRDERVRSKRINSIKGFIEGNAVLCNVLCIIAASLDPLFCYVLVIDEQRDCIGFDTKLRAIVVILRSVVDFFYVIFIIFHFCNASERGGAWSKAWRYFLSSFTVDVLAVLPLPQVMVLLVIPKLKGSQFMVTLRSLKFIFLIQYLPRVFRIYSFSNKVRWSSDILLDTAEVKAVFNLFLYLLASYVFGAFWYLFSIDRKAACWRENCPIRLHCALNCHYVSRERLPMNASCSAKAPKGVAAFDFGIFGDAFGSGVVSSSDFMWKVSYCYWWGLRNLSALGQNLATSNHIWEIYFAATICISGLVLFALLIGNLQTFLQARFARLEKMRLKRQDIEAWMSNNYLPRDLKKRIKRYEQGKWRETGGVDVENFLNNLPRDLQRDIKRHLCYGAIKRVPMFVMMDEQFLDAICHHLRSVLYTKDTSIVEEGDPVEEMLFITRGKLLASTNNGGRTTSVLTSQFLITGDFVGEELLDWALFSHSSTNLLPISARSIRALEEVRAFALKADDLKTVVSRFRRGYHQQLHHTFRFYSREWRNWAASFIQSAWRRKSRRKLEKALREEENRFRDALDHRAPGTPPASRFYATVRRAVEEAAHKDLVLEKPSEPDFAAE